MLLLVLQNNFLILQCRILGRKIDRVLPGGGGGVRPPPLVVGPQISTSPSDPMMDNITSLFSATSLGTAPRAATSTTVLRHLNPAQQYRVDEVIRDVPMQDLTATNPNDMVYPNHPCFDRSRRFAQRWSISYQAIDNHVKLACGNRRFPVLMLLNPSPGHNDMTFDTMVRHCWTLDWIQGVLKEIGLTLSEVIVLDICPLLSNDYIEKMNENNKYHALNEAFQLTQDMLQLIKPNIIISCQCSTAAGEKWGYVRHDIASKLCSSIPGAKSGQVIKTDIEGHAIHVVQAYHLAGRFKSGDHFDKNGEFLRRLLLRLYRPCNSSRLY